MCLSKTMIEIIIEYKTIKKCLIKSVANNKMTEKNMQ